MMKNSKMKKLSSEEKKGGHQSLLNLVFSWSIKDVLNNNLFSDKVKEIPDIFPSTADYFDAFKWPLIEETRAEYFSGLESIGHAPACEISAIWLSGSYKPPKDLYYDISTKVISDANDHGTHYDPEFGDIFAVTNQRPRNIRDLIKPDKSLHVAFVSGSNEDAIRFEILSSEKIDRQLFAKKNVKLFVTYLMNITTNLRIWRALNPSPKSKNLGLIQKVLQYNSLVDDDCSLCKPEEVFKVKRSKVCELIGSFGLNESQREAVLSSIFLEDCPHKEYSIKLIWGPPGTGKTKTVASLLYVLLKLKSCTTLTCAPTNIAVIQVAKRLVALFVESLEYKTYGLGDIVLFGNEERMKIDDHSELMDIFLKYRVKILQDCLAPLSGWKHSLESMIALLENPQARYDAYLVPNRKADIDKKAEGDQSCDESGDGSNVEATKAKQVEGARRSKTKAWKKMIVQTVRENKKNNKKESRNGRQGKHSEETSEAIEDHETKIEKHMMTFEEFVSRNFLSLANRLVFCAENLYTHLPTSCCPLYVAKEMIRLVDLLNVILKSARSNVFLSSELIMMKSEEILAVLKMLHVRFRCPEVDGNLKNFCLEYARIIFCTASGAIKMRSYVDMVIIDEAAQLKECESAIPLQIPGLINAILVGDDQQLPAMVRSKILEKKAFGRSLFQRLALLGKRKHLLNMQYRMHPSISLFPNKKFYENKIVDAPNVKERSYAKNFLKRGMYGSYSFINVSSGTENFKQGPSPRNFEEAAVVQRIVAKLFKDYYCIKKQKVSVGVISPYKGQVGLLEEIFEKKYTKHKDSFCINIRSVDGFQGGEQDIIIFSTVRSNINGSVGFLANCQRTNVALTRARYCLWIVGSGSTLGNSGTVWENLLHNAKTRGCFYDAEDDIDLKQVTSSGASRFFAHLKVEKARWKIIFSDEFKSSISSMSVKVQKRVKKVLHKIAHGWRQSNSEKPLNAALDDTVVSVLLELYKVDEKLTLAWTVELLEEESSYTQVIKVWDILPAHRIPNLATHLSVLFRGYTVDILNRCKDIFSEGDLAVPMSWPLHSSADPPSCLLSKIAAINLGVNQGEPSSRARKNVASIRKPLQR